jgi:5'-3' exoribonuclease 1
MGIPSYFKYIITEYRQIIKENKNILINNNLFIDSNSIIYDSVLQLKNDLNIKKATKIPSKKVFEQKILDQVFIKLSKYINDLKPTDLVYIAFDGVAPCAKLHQQRTRRYKSNIEKKIFEQLNLPVDQIWNTCAITPGTEFMNKLDIFINKKLDNKKLGVKNIIVSGPNIPGEGEHKIFEYIRNNKHIKNKNNIIYGLDADLIMLSLNHLVHSNNLYLYNLTRVIY